METQMPKIPSSGEKISIVDLLVILLKHRKIFAGIMVSVFCAALVGYFTFPPYQFKRQPGPEDREAELTVTMAASLAPGADYFLPSHQYSYFFRKPDIVIEALEKSNIISSREKTSGWVLPVNGVYLDGNKEGKIYKSPNGKLAVKEYLETGVIEFVFLNPRGEQGISFLNSLFELGNEVTGAYIKSLGRDYVKAFEKSGFLNSENILAEREQDNYFFASRFLSGSVEAFDIYFDPYVIDPKPETGNLLKPLTEFQKNYRSRALLFVFAALFLSIFLVFFINAIEDIKNDKESIDKIRNVFNP
jgi:hypothetical protein